jgi:hypothetical protein
VREGSWSATDHVGMRAFVIARRLHGDSLLLGACMLALSAADTSAEDHPGTSRPHARAWLLYPSSLLQVVSEHGHVEEVMAQGRGALQNALQTIPHRDDAEAPTMRCRADSRPNCRSVGGGDAGADVASPSR